MSEKRCGYAITDADGVEEPCDRPATGWRWYQDVGEHGDTLAVACDWHANEGGRRIVAAREQGIRQAVEWLRAGYEYGTGPDWREQGCEWIEQRAADERMSAPTPCPTCGGAGIVDTSPPGVEHTAPWLLTDTDCGACGGTGEIPEEKP